MTQVLRRPLFALVVLTGVACVHRVDPVVAEKPPAPPPPPPIMEVDRTMRFEPVVITASPEQVAISSLNDAELFAIGNAAMGGGDNAKACLHFERLADNFPKSGYRPEALFKAGQLLERMKDYAGALSRFLEASKAYGETPEGAEASFKAADEYFFMSDYDRAVALLEPLTHAAYLPGVRQAEAKTKTGVCLFTAGKLDDSEKILRAVVKEIQDELRDETHDGYLPSQAQFYLAEIYRQHFEDIKLDPVTSTEQKLLEDLEAKAQMLLSAQGHYLRCIRVGHPEWATASGYRIGELYQSLYEQMVDARPPQDLDKDQVEAYQVELRNRIRILVSKAIVAYEQTLTAAERVGATNPFIAQTRTSLEKMKALLLKDDATATGTPATTPATAPTKDPDES